MFRSHTSGRAPTTAAPVTTSTRRPAEQHEEHAVVHALAPDAPQVEEPAREVAVRGELGEAVEPRDVLEQHDRELVARRRVQRLKVAIDRRGRFGAQVVGASDTQFPW